MKTLKALTIVSLALIALAGCKPEPTCETGELPASFEGEPLSNLVPSAEGVVDCKESAENHAVFWRPVRVHRANVDAVGVAQDNGFERLSDNWYSTEGNFDTPKWSEFEGPAGLLRVDVREDGDGSKIEMKYTPKG